MSDPFTLYRLAESLRAEFRNRYLTSAEGSSREHGRKVGDVKNGRSVEVDSALTIAHPVVEVMDVRKDIGVAHHNALRPVGCAAGIDKGQNRFWIIKVLGRKIV